MTCKSKHCLFAFSRGFGCSARAGYCFCGLSPPYGISRYQQTDSGKSLVQLVLLATKLHPCARVLDACRTGRGLLLETITNIVFLLHLKLFLLSVLQLSWQCWFCLWWPTCVGWLSRLRPFTACMREYIYTLFFFIKCHASLRALRDFANLQFLTSVRLAPISEFLYTDTRRSALIIYNMQLEMLMSQSDPRYT